jgi:hypothetical protein
MDLEPVGAAATAGLAAGAIEKPAAKAGEEQHLCTDCGAKVIGRFCHECGQPAHVHRTLLHLGEELLHGVMHFDGRVWRTLPMLFFRPGTLTRHWIEGKRARYVSPLAIFLFTIFILFMVLSYLPPVSGRTIVEARTQAAADLREKGAEVAKAEAALAAAAPAGKVEAGDRLERARAELKEAQDDLAVLNSVGAGVTPEAELGAVLKEETRNVSINTGNSAWDKRIRKAIENPEYSLYKLQQSFYKFSFLLVPLSIPFVALLFLWKRGFSLYDHGVFILYSITFVSMMFMLGGLADRVGGLLKDLMAVAIVLAIPLHMFFQLKGTYRLRTLSALWRTFVLLIFCNVALALFALTVTVLTFA